jgi:sec-independent protein translocase protein TatB
MFDIAWSELLIIGVVALVVVGPKDLPKLMRTAGQWMGRARAMADQFKRSFDDMARQAELDELRKEVDRMKTDQMFDDIAKQTLMPPEIAAAQSELQQATMLPPGAVNFEPLKATTELVPPAQGAAPQPPQVGMPLPEEPAAVPAQGAGPQPQAEPALPKDGAPVVPPQP